MKTIQIIKKISYLTTCNYCVWMLSSLFIFLPFTMVVLLINATRIGLLTAKDYLIERDFKISFTYNTYVRAKGFITRDYIKNYGRQHHQHQI